MRSVAGQNAVALDSCNAMAAALLARDDSPVGVALQELVSPAVALVLLDHLNAAVTRRRAVSASVELAFAGGMCAGTAHFEPILRAGADDVARVVVFVSTGRDGRARVNEDRL